MKLWTVLRKPADDAAQALSCSFCDKSQHAVRRLIAGSGVRICDECIALCNEIIAYDIEEEAPAEPAAEGAGLVIYVGEKNVSSWSMRGWLAVVHKGIPFEERTIRLQEDRDRARRRKVSPTGRVPVLHHGDVVVPDSIAIIEYLEEAFPPPRYPALWPKDRGDRSRARWLAATMHASFFKVREHMSFNYCFLPAPPPAPREAFEEALEILSYWEDALARKTAEGPYLFGPFSGADILFAPVVVRLTAFRVPADKTPRARDYMAAVLEQPGVKRWMDEARKLPPVERE